MIKLSVSNVSRSRYGGILDKFIQFCSTPNNLPVIKRGDLPQLVLVAFKEKEDAVRALALEDVHVAPASRN